MYAIPDPHYRHLYNSMPGACLVLMPDLTIVAANKAYLSLVHLTEKKIAGSFYFDLFPVMTESCKVLQHSFKKVQQQAVTDEIPILDYCLPGPEKDPHQQYWKVSNTPVFDDENGLLYIIHTLTKIITPASVLNTVSNKHTGKTFPANERQYYNMLNNMLEGIQIHDFNWRYVFVNESLLRFARSTREELIGKTLMEQYPGIEQSQLFKTMERVMRTRVMEQLETEFIFPDGLVGFYQLSIEPVPEGIFVLSIDITERKKIEQQILQSEENLKAIFDNATEGFVLTDRDGKVKAYNKMVKESIILNLSDEIEEGSNIFDLVEKERKDFFRQVFNKVLEGETIQYDKQYTRKNGKVSWINLIFNPVFKNNISTGICITGRDVTDRKKAEDLLQKAYTEKQILAERMSAILNTLPANIALVDKDGSIVEVNDAWRSFTADGFKGKDYPVGKNYIRVSEKAQGEGKEDKMNMASGLEAVLEEALDEFVYEYSSDETDTEKWYRMIATPLQEEEYSGAVIMHMDISEIRRLEAERMKSKIEEQKKITQAIIKGQEKERNYIGMELHDNINQILAGVRMYLAIASNKDPAVKEVIQYPLQLLDKSIEEIRFLCSNMVTPLQNVKLEDMIREMMIKMGRNNNIVASLNYKVPGDKLSDELKLNVYRIIQELGNNIIKYANASHVTVDIWLDKGKLCMTVTDNGKGFNIDSKRNGIG
ncbi:MAG: PAS domain S-box protein, partial [Sphingobacteriales bacterium]